MTKILINNKIINQLKIENKKLKIGNVFVWGAFDIIHDGHIKFLKTAQKFGDVYVILVPDKVVKKYKKLYFNAVDRKKHLMKTGFIKKVFVDALPSIKCFKKTHPDIFIFGYDQNKEWNNILKKYILDKFPNCKFKTLKKYSETHSSHIKEKILCYCHSGKKFIDCCGK